MSEPQWEEQSDREPDPGENPYAAPKALSSRKIGPMGEFSIGCLTVLSTAIAFFTACFVSINVDVPNLALEAPCMAAIFVGVVVYLLLDRRQRS